jgi:glyoxylase-like metal-dependent hydrolase (beta-lactamase superfamily II)
VSTTDVTDVILTHLHSDHVGWSVHGDSAAPLPTFSNARHLVQQAEVARLAAGGPGQRALHDSHLRPLLDAGLVETVDGAATPLPHVSLVPSPGHTTGHQSVAVDRADTALLISGDAFVHPAQVTDPSVEYVNEDDRATAIRTRRRILADAAANPTLLATAHFDATTVLLEVGPDGARLTPVQTCTSP